MTIGVLSDLETGVKWYHNCPSSTVLLLNTPNDSTMLIFSFFMIIPQVYDSHSGLWFGFPPPKRA